MHASRDCLKSMHVCKRLVPSNIMGKFFKACLKNWINFNLKLVKEKKIKVECGL